MNNFMVSVLGAFALELRQDIGVDHERQSARSERILRGRALALRKQAEAQRAGAIWSGVSSVADAAASAVSTAKDYVVKPFADGKVGDLSVDARADLKKADSPLKKTEKVLSEAGRLLGGAKQEQDDRARLEGEKAADLSRFDSGVDRAERSTDRQESLAVSLLVQAKRA